MKKYLVPCAALVGIALLTPRVDAANLIIKSRAEPISGTTLPTGGTATGNVSLPVLVTAVSANQLWGIDFGLTLPAGSPAPVAAQGLVNGDFVPTVVSTSDVVVTGAPITDTTVGLYVGYVKGATGISASGTTQTAIGLLKLKNTSGAVISSASTGYTLTVPATYNVKNDGTGNAVSRPGASGVTSTATAGDPVVSETVTVLSATGAGALNVPLKTVLNGIPGDLTGDKLINGSDLAAMKAVIQGTAGARTAFRLITGDIAPTNGYTTANPGGTAGLGYGDAIINASDLAALKQKIAGTATVFPAAE